MAEDTREALDRLIAAFERHHEVACAASSANSRAMEDAEEALADAFFTYDDVLFTKLGIELPFDILDEDDEDFDDEDDDLEFLEDEDEEDDDLVDIEAD